MTPPPSKQQPGLDDVYVDQVARKARFLADHPDAAITHHPEASPHERWQGQVAGFPKVSDADLGHLLDKLADQVGARDARTRWPNWTFTRTHAGWQAKQVAGPELLMARTLADVEARVGQWERIAGRP